ncbi:hemerythrin domain-containing protein [Tenggerimyces flavus]|uniref:Hemerythrin domain-containing protein n=1 Tax=Tenggerimyces flavus TaxID=1708749 RepID=A0ABV7YAS5_9ACTN|nr:hemerythrin domain-containing protein [Tenggerimyces flavus]MBM7785598.1 hemerythrin-like domain-containing protein [Tenggerimyces flavus]
MTDRAAAYVRQLLAAHDYFRTGLADLRRVIAAPPEKTEEAELRSWASDLRIQCLYFCNGLHMHHTLEDQRMFPAVLVEDPELGPIVERLEADHRKVAEIIDAIESRLGELSSDPSGVREELNRMADALLEHLAYEEEQLTPVLARMTGPI